MFRRGDSRRKSRSRDARRLNFESLEHRVVMSATNLVPDQPLEADPVAATEPTPLPALSIEDWVHGLLYFQFNQLTVDTVRFVTPQQISTIPNAYDFQYFMSAPVRAALSQTQVQALRVGSVGLDYLTPQQIGWLSLPQVQSLQLPDFKNLSPFQIPFLTPAQIATIPDPGPFSEWSLPSVAALTPTQIQSLRVGTVWLIRLTPTQISWLTAAQIKTLRVADFKYLSPAQVPYLTARQIAAIPDPGPFAEWSAASRAALTVSQVQALNVANVWLDRLTPLQTSWLTAAQIRTLRVADFHYLNALQVPLLTTAQVAAIPDPGPFSNWSAAARAALTAVQVQALDVANVWIDRLTPQQVRWLAVEQIRSLRIADLQYLDELQVPFVSLLQIATIPDAGPFSAWSADALAALTLPQVQALRVNAIGVSMLTPLQASWLSLSQIQSLNAGDFKYLNALQVPLLTLAQIRSIPDAGMLADWRVFCRAALTQQQVQALDFSRMGLDQMTAQQISWLTDAQIRSLSYIFFHLLAPGQIPTLTPQQVASMPPGVIRSLPDTVQTSLTREQFMALSKEQISQYMVSFVPPIESYIPAVDIPLDPNGVRLGHSEMFEPAINLVPLAGATHLAVASGSWSDPRTWQGGRIPTAGARVVIASGVAVQFDAAMSSTAAIKTLRIDGTLSFATDRNTQIYVDTIVVNTSGKLNIGTPIAPIGDNVVAKVTITGGGPIDTTWDPFLISRGLVSRGQVQMYGKSVTPYAMIAVAPVRGATQMTLTEVPQNWRVGDKIVIMGVHAHVQGHQDEERIIRGISGNTIYFDALAYDHVPPAGFGMSVYAANFTRNIQFTSVENAPPLQRPHMMFMQNPNVDISNISVVGFGRTDKSIPINDPVVVNGVLQPGTGTNPRARYAIHFHHTGVNPDVAPAVVRGSVVSNGAGWGFVNHQSNVVMTNNVTYNVLGSGFVAEDGNEIGLMANNLAMNSTGSGDEIESRVAIHDFGHGGHGFWLQGPGVALSGNIASGQADSAFVYFTSSTKVLYDAVNLTDQSLAGGKKAIPVGAAPIKLFVNNIAATSKAGLEVWFHQTFMNDGQSYIENFKTWNIRSSGVFLFYTGRISVLNSTIIGDMTLFRGVGINSIGLTHDVTVVNPRVEGWEIGVKLGHRRANLLYGATINAVQGIFIKGAYDTIRTLDIVGTTILTPTTAQLRGRTPYQIYLTGKPDFEFQSVASILAPDRIRIMRYNYTLATLFYEEAAPDYVAFPRSEYLGMVPDEYLDLTNAQLQARFGVSIGGGYPPSDAVIPYGYRGRVDFTPGR